MIRNIAFAFILCSLFSCSNKANKTENTTETQVVEDTAAVATEVSAATPAGKVNCYQGMMNGKIPVLVAFAVDDSLIHGEITYLNTKKRAPITLLGEYNGDGRYDIMEFEKNGNVSGLLSVTMKQNTLEGNWYSPMSQKEFTLSLQAKDTTYELPDITFNPNNMNGSYYQRFSEDGPDGNFDIAAVGNDRVAFNALCTTNGPAYNIADIQRDTVKLSSDHFVYHMPDSDSCDFTVRIYNGFLRVTYVNGYNACVGFFGHNATVEGIFLKVK